MKDNKLRKWYKNKKKWGLTLEKERESEME